MKTVIALLALLIWTGGFVTFVQCQQPIPPLVGLNIKELPPPQMVPPGMPVPPRPPFVQQAQPAQSGYEIQIRALMEENRKLREDLQKCQQGKR